MTDPISTKDSVISYTDVLNGRATLETHLRNYLETDRVRFALSLIALSCAGCLVNSIGSASFSAPTGEEKTAAKKVAPKPLSAQELKKLEHEAELLTGNHNARQVIALTTNVLERNPNNPVFLALRGKAFLKIRKRPNAIEDFTASLKLRPDINTYRERAYTYKLMGDAQGCLNDRRTVARLAPTARNVLEVANAQMTLGNINECIEGCKKALTMLDSEPANKRNWAELECNEVLGQAYLGIDQPAKALGPLTRAVELVPGYAEAKKKEHSTSPLASARKYPDANLRRGEALEKTGRLKEAIVDYETAVQARPKSFDYRRSLLRAYRKYNQNDKALALVNQLLIEDDSPDLFYKRADIYKKLGKKDLAKIDEERAKKSEFDIMGSAKSQ